MKIYFAGTTLIREREQFLIIRKVARLFSYHNHSDKGMACKDFKIWKGLFFKDVKE